MTLAATEIAASGSWPRTYGPWILGALALLLAPHFFYPLFLAKILCFALFASAFNLLLGSCGLLSFGHSAYYGAAAYVAAYAAKGWGLPFELSILLGALAATLIGGGFGYLSIRRQGLQFAMITLALAQMIYFLALQLPFTHAEDGLTGVPRGKVLGLFALDDIRTLYYTVAVIFVLGLFCVHRITHSTFGQILRSIRDNEPRAISLGFDTNRFKLLAFTLSATLAGVAGATKAIVFKLATLTDVHWSTSGSIILMTLLGGLGTLWGPVVGALIVVTLEDYLADAGLPIEAVIGAIFILCILLFRRGVVGELQALLLPRSPSSKP
jgi:branched-chain amino acid transport system permease protein